MLNWLWGAQRFLARAVWHLRACYTATPGPAIQPSRPASSYPAPGARAPLVGLLAWQCTAERKGRSRMGNRVGREWAITWAHGVVVSHPLSMREALGSIPSVSIVVLKWHCFVCLVAATELQPCVGALRAGTGAAQCGRRRSGARAVALPYALLWGQTLGQAM